jgi:hypothetical protein
MSALNEVDENSLVFLMNKLPSTYSDEEGGKIVDILQNQRLTMTEVKPSAGKKTAASPDLSLDDLGL